MLKTLQIFKETVVDSIFIYPSIEHVTISILLLIYFLLSPRTDHRFLNDNIDCLVLTKSTCQNTSYYHYYYSILIADFKKHFKSFIVVNLSISALGVFSNNCKTQQRFFSNVSLLLYIWQTTQTQPYLQTFYNQYLYHYKIYFFFFSL